MSTPAWFLRWLLLPALLVPPGIAKTAHDDSSAVEIAHGDAGHDSHQWHVEPYEYMFSEVIVLIHLVILAVIFELIYHGVLHKVEHTYRFGAKHEHHAHEPGLCFHVSQGLFHNPACGPGKIKTREKPKMEHSHEHGHGHEEDHGHGSHHDLDHAQLWKLLVTRAGGEFMILGWLAFAIFLFHRCHGFDALQHGPASDAFRMPDSSDAWLHLTEDTHMRLFLGMVIYFISLGVTLRTYVARISMYEDIQRHLFLGTEPELIDETMLRTGMWNCLSCAPSSRAVCRRWKPHNASAVLEEYILIREFFVGEIVGWRQNRPDVFEAVRDILCLPDACGAEQVAAELRRRLALSTYMALIIEEALHDMVQMPTRTWMCVIVELAVVAVIFRAKVQVKLYVFAVCYASMLLVIILLTAEVIRWRRIHIRQNVEHCNVQETNEEHWFLLRVRTCGRRYKVENIAIRTWEVVRFSAIYIIAWTLMDVAFGFEHYSVGHILAYFCVFVLECFLLTWSGLIDAYLLMALPPFVDESNLHKLFWALREDHLLDANRHLPSTWPKDADDDRRQRPFGKDGVNTIYVASCRHQEQQSDHGVANQGTPPQWPQDLGPSPHKADVDTALPGAVN
mmetsp:Transcript_15781/g.43124  ORF Transcript_15781/g.43124 Transcript_15781/m.43124 type:complete len:620 (-) Transcript_15781:157-2016(-)